MSAPWAKPTVLPEDPLDKPARKRIRTKVDCDKWLKGNSYVQLTAFLSILNDSVKGMTATEGQAKPKGTALKGIEDHIDELYSIIDDIPLQDLSQQRYGNKAFKTWHARMCDKSIPVFENLLPDKHKSLAPEIAVYWKDAFGNDTRIDYGTGHELNFVMVLYCLTKIECIQADESATMVLSTFRKYIHLMRRLQSHYSLEPAGSKGVWGLDDYHHLTFYWGSSQLLDHPSITPDNVLRVCAEGASEYMYLEGINWIRTNKTGNFSECSPTLASLSPLGWTKINKGMFKMYHGEVLAQWPVVQHLCFGTIFPWAEDAE
eukprot:TRINITY_DN2515_c0_g2_i1.p1 TRINITY_DN2515_c0_g2~~TRINITY_DN2515_c0_g2_i1.p1  ORF type:complete len:317 (+),score=49.63 TRINITY_DN2515_c0_g2_i1:48-998(+)